MLCLAAAGIAQSAAPIQAESFLFLDQTYSHRGTSRLHANWDFVTRLPHVTGAPKNWESPVNFKDGTFEFRIEPLEMQQLDDNAQISFGWLNDENDRTRRHTTGGSIYFADPGIYEVEAGVQNLAIYRGDNDQLTRAWDWGSAYESNSIFTIINPQANPRTAGFPFRLHVTVKIYSNDTVKPAAPEGLTVAAVSSSRMDLRWTDNSDNEETFKINRFWKGSWKLIAEVGPNTTTFSDTLLPPRRFYSYKVAGRTTPRTAIRPTQMWRPARR